MDWTIPDPGTGREAQQYMGRAEIGEYLVGVEFSAGAPGTTTNLSLHVRKSLDTAVLMSRVRLVAPTGGTPPVGDETALAVSTRHDDLRVIQWMPSRLERGDRPVPHSPVAVRQARHFCP